MSAPTVTVRLVAIAVVAAVTLTVAPAPATSAPTPAETTYGNKVFALVNNVRDNHDRVELKRNKCLQGFANRKAEALAESQNTNLPHSNLTKIQNKCGVGWVGENLIYGSVGITPRQIVNGWMNSTDHRANILKRKYRITGVAARKGGGIWWVVQIFGRKV